MKEGTTVVEFKKQLIAPKPVRVSLIALRHHFDRCSQRYTPIYHELFEPWMDVDLSAFDAESVCRSFCDAFVENFQDRWEEWHALHDVEYFGRFYGTDGWGLGEFKRLAESAYLVLREAEPNRLGQRYDNCHGYHGWIRLMHDMAYSYPTPLLRSEYDIWGKEDCTGPFKESELATCGQSIDGISYPLYPFFWGLAHDVVTSSIAAIDLILDNETALLVGDWMGEFPVSYLNEDKFVGLTPQGINEIVSEEPQEPSETEFVPPIVGFSFDGMWHLAFDAGDQFEKATLPKSPGLAVYAMLLRRPNEEITPVSILKETGQIKTAEEGAAEADHVLGVIGLRNVRDEIQRLQREIDDTVNPDRRSELEEEQKQLLRCENSSLDHRGKLRKTATDKLNKRIHAQLLRARNQIKEEMPEFAKHLKRTVSAKSGDFVYEP